MRTPKATSAIMAYAKSNDEFTPNDVAHFCTSPSTARNLCRWLTRTGKLKVIRKGVIGRYSQPAVYQAV